MPKTIYCANCGKPEHTNGKVSIYYIGMPNPYKIPGVSDMFQIKGLCEKCKARIEKENVPVIPFS